jgi:hypothetical protein
LLGKAKGPHATRSVLYDRAARLEGHGHIGVRPGIRTCQRNPWDALSLNKQHEWKAKVLQSSNVTVCFTGKAQGERKANA